MNKLYFTLLTSLSLVLNSQARNDSRSASFPQALVSALIFIHIEVPTAYFALIFPRPT